MALPKIRDCKHKNCRYEFPQFKPLDPVEFRSRLLLAIEGRGQQHKACFEQAIALIDEGKIHLAAELAGEKYGYELYEDNYGHVAIYCPCCH